MKHKMNPLKHKLHFNTEDGLHITIQTDRLLLRSILSKDENDCIALTANPDVMEKYATGKPWDATIVRARMSIWISRWNNHDPFSIYTIVEKNSGNFIGIMGIGHSKPGESEAIYILDNKFWGKGYGSEAADAIFQSLIPNLMLRDYQLDYKPLKKLVATARLDNAASQHMLINVGFKEEEKSYKFGALRFSYGLFAKQIRNEYQNFFNRAANELYKQKHKAIKNEGVDITDIEMANSAFGRKR